MNTIGRSARLLVCALIALVLLAPAGAQAAFGVASFDGQVTAGPAPDPLPNPGDPLDPANFAPPFTQAGGHPFDASTTISYNTVPNQFGGEVIDGGQAKDIVVELPAGFVGNPLAVPRCSEEQLAVSAYEGCPAASAIGYVDITQVFFFPNVLQVPIYNMVPPDDVPGRFAFNVAGVLIHLDASVRSEGDYGLTVTVRDINQGVIMNATRLTLWGVPADPAHDGLRGRCLVFGGECPANIPSRPFLTNPGNCDAGPVATRLRTDSWSSPGSSAEASFISHLPPGDPTPATDRGTPQGVTGCDRVPFDPALAVRPASTRAGAPAGYTFDITVPQDDNPAGIAQGLVRRVEVRLPEGARVSPSAAAGLGACTADEIALGLAAESRCPQSAKVGSVQIDTPLLSDPMTGSVYLATPRANRFGSLVALYLVARGPGVAIKLAGRIDADPATGRLTASFDDNPQLPFSRLRLELFGGDRATMTNPPECGSYRADATISSWSGKVATTASSFTIDTDASGGPCAPRGFAPRFVAGTVNPTAGGSSSFTLGFARSDGDQELAGITAELPTGLLGRIADTTLCSDAAAVANACGTASRIGSVATAAGPGPSPFQLPGSVFITGPYKGAQFGLAIEVPAVAGPFDLGVVVVRAALFIDPSTTQLRIVSDALPTILEGIPLQLRSVQVRIDRPGFMTNPTNCGAKRVAARLSSVQGRFADVASRYQVGNCSRLAFAPRMELTIGSRGRTRKGLTTPLAVRLTMPRGNANNRSVQVTLPRSVNARLDVVNKRRACSIEQFRADRCPMAVGTVSAVTPLLRDPLRGSVYFVYNPVRRLPDLVARLRGAVAIDLIGKVTITRDLRLQTTFDTIPDAPISSFSLRLVAGRRGPVGAVDNLCATTTRRRLRARLVLVAHSARQVAREQQLRVAGCGR